MNVKEAASAKNAEASEGYQPMATDYQVMVVAVVAAAVVAAVVVAVAAVAVAAVAVVVAAATARESAQSASVLENVRLRV